MTRGQEVTRHGTAPRERGWFSQSGDSIAFGFRKFFIGNQYTLRRGRGIRESNSSPPQLQSGRCNIRVSSAALSSAIVNSCLGPDGRFDKTWPASFQL